jgi:hypothetical protein
MLRLSVGKLNPGIETKWVRIVPEPHNTSSVELYTSSPQCVLITAATYTAASGPL